MMSLATVINNTSNCLKNDAACKFQSRKCKFQSRKSGVCEARLNVGQICTPCLVRGYIGVGEGGGKSGLRLNSRSGERQQHDGFMDKHSMRDRVQEAG